MLKKIVFLFILAYCSTSLMLKAQCPISVGITTVPDVSTTAVCKSTVVQLTANPSVGALTPQYLWVVGSDTITGSSTSISVFANNQTVQLVMLTSNGCTSDSAYAAIIVNTVIIQPTVNIVNSKCDLSSADIEITSTGGAAPYNYNLVGVGTSTDGIYNAIVPGTYTLMLTDNQGCNDTSQVTITPIPNKLQPNINPIVTECNQTTADVEITTTGGTAPYAYDLQTISQNTDGFFPQVPAGDYTLITTDSQGCVDTNVVSIVPFQCPDPIPIAAITPNGDGYNDTWVIAYINLYPDNEVYIFDRWGQRVYHKKNYDNIDGWDAKYLGVDMPVSTYYYVLKVMLKQSKDKVYKGAISVFR